MLEIVRKFAMFCIGNHLEKQNIELNAITELSKLFGFKKKYILDRPDTADFEYEEDLNERRLRDAEVLGTIIHNTQAQTILEIGTSDGQGTVHIAANAPKTAHIYTVNIPPEDILRGVGGKHTTWALERERIGIAFKKRKLKNITQIYANTATWDFNVPLIDVAFIDGCHDARFVFNDTRNVLKKMRPGGFIILHDYNYDLRKKYRWIGDVCTGINRLYRYGYLRGRIYHVRDSWMAVYRVPLHGK